MRSKGIPFIEKDIEKDPGAKAALVHKLGKVSVPVLEVNGQTLVGFDASALDRML